MPLVSVIARVEGDEDLIARLKTPLDQITAVRAVVRKFSRIAVREATANVSNRSVNYEGNTFIIHRVTGNLARSIQVTEVTPLTATIIATGGGEHGEDYAAAVEEGHKAFDLKPYLMGKTIPLPVGKAMAGAPGVVKVPRVATTGRMMGGKFIMFRRVGPNSKGWIIPEMKPRPFMGAAGAAIAEPFGQAVAEAIRSRIEGDEPHDTTS